MGHSGSYTASTEKGVDELVSRWCSAYRRSDPERLAALETGEVEIVDRFGAWHDLVGRKARNGFWTDGFEMLRREDFHPECTVQHVHLTRWNLAIAQVTVSYHDGIALKGGERVPPFSEIHTFVLVRTKGGWLFSAQDIVPQNCPEQGEGSARSSDSSSRVWGNQHAVEALSGGH